MSSVLLRAGKVQMEETARARAMHNTRNSVMSTYLDSERWYKIAMQPHT